VLLTLRGWTSRRIAEAFAVREDTVRLWRGDFMRGGFEAVKASIAPGPVPVKTAAALRVITPLLEAPVADRPNWTIPRLIAEIKTREGVIIGRSQLSKALRKKVPLAPAATHAEGPPDRRRDRPRRPEIATAQGTGQGRRHRVALRRRERGSDPSLSRPRLGQAGCRSARSGTRAMEESRHDGCARLVAAQADRRAKRSADFIALLVALDHLYGPKPGVPTKPVVIVLDNGPVHVSKATAAALAARAHWLTVEWLPKYAPELNDIEVVWHDLKAFNLAHCAPAS
jgi:transposase